MLATGRGVCQIPRYCISSVIVFLFVRQLPSLEMKYSNQRSVNSCMRITTTPSIVMSHFNVIRVTNNLCQFSPSGTKVACCFGNKLTIRKTSTFEQWHTFFCVDIVDVSTYKELITLMFIKSRLMQHITKLCEHFNVKQT